jgi:hypothetical protein
MDPPPSEPTAIGTRPAATEAAAPPLDAPDIRDVSHGFTDSPTSRFFDRGQEANSGRLVLPTIIAPAALSLSDTVPSRCGRKRPKASEPPVEEHRNYGRFGQSEPSLAEHGILVKPRPELAAASITPGAPRIPKEGVG